MFIIKRHLSRINYRSTIFSLEKYLNHSLSSSNTILYKFMKDIKKQLRKINPPIFQCENIIINYVEPFVLGELWHQSVTYKLINIG